MDAKDTVILGIAVAAALGIHLFVRRFVVACALCVTIAVLACLIYLGTDFVRQGLPPAKLFWVPLMVAIPAGLALVIAVAVGLPFYLYRRKNRVERGNHPS
jgi:hypothetical protein